MYRNGSRSFLAMLLFLAILLMTQVLHAATPAPAAPGPPLPSSFSGPFWQVKTPAGGTVSVSNGHLFLNVPGGSNHDALTSGNHAVRVVQPIGNTNFDVSIKIDSTVAAGNKGTKEGLMVISDVRNFITYELAADGSNIHLSAEIVAGGVARSVFDDGGFGQYQSPMYLRLTKTASAYVAYYSTDGSTWISATNFIYAKIPKLIGPFASNYSPTPSNAIQVEMSINWFKVQLAVNKATPTITWATPAPVAAGTALSATQLNATASVPGSFMYTPAVGAVLAAGTQQLTAAFSPTDTTNYSSATAHASVVVASPTPGPPTPGPTPAGGCQLTSGASTSAIQAAIDLAATNSCPGPSTSTVLFTAGSYTISTRLSIPCPKAAMAIQGPTPAGVGTTWPITPTAVLTSTLTDNWAFAGTACGVGTTIQYLRYNGGNPSGGGGGFLLASPGMNNLTVTYNWFYGNAAIQTTQQSADAFIWLDGSTSSARTKNALIKWNRFGYPGSNDCAGLMNLFGGGGGPGTCSSNGYAPPGGRSTCLYQQGSNLNRSGGSCAAVGIHALTDGLVISNNSISHQEQAFKIFENVTTDSNGSTNSTLCNNDMDGIHRIGFETQSNNSNIVVCNNDFHDPIFPNAGQWALSLPQNNVNSTGNVLLANTAIANDRNGNPASYAGNAIEFWGSGTSSNNLIQGLFNGGIEWGFTPGGWSANDNIIQLTTSNSFIGNEEGGSTPPSQTGNVTGRTVSVLTSTTPSISPAAGNVAFPVTVTLTDPGSTSGAGPRGNTGIWYTTDGSTPTPGSGTAKYLASGQTFSLAPAATVKAVGMWGALNQPASYPSGFGFVPSTVVTASYTTPSTAKPAAAARISSSSGQGAAAIHSPPPSRVVAPALQSVAIDPSQPVVAIGSTTQLKAIASFDDGSVKDVTADFGWLSSDMRTILADESGVVSGLASGPSIISGSYQGVRASVAASSAIGEVEWGGPIVITAGGTYAGNWQSTDSKTPAVTVATTDPVTIENSHISSVGNLIKTSVAGSNLTVRNSLSVALNAAVKGQPNGNFIEVSSPARLDVENNYVENAQGGVIVHGYAGKRDGQQTIVIRANRARNLNGLLSDGNGGYLPGEGANRSHAHFIQFESVQSVPGIDVGWNEVINYPGRSLVEDNIDIYRSSGTANQPLEIHDTYIQGAYPYKPAQDAYTGGGIKTDGSIDDTAQDAPAYNSIHDNQVVGTVSYGISFAAGHDNIAANNRVISSGLLSDGTKIAAQGVGLANGATAGPSASMYNNTMRDNLVGWTCWKSACAQTGYRKDQFFPASPADYSANSVMATAQITFNMEDNEYQVWLNKLSSAAVAIGPAF
jgi:hypothetical protein